MRESHESDQIHQVLGNHDESTSNRDEVLEVLETGIFPKKPKRAESLTTDELIQQYLKQDVLVPKGQRKYEGLDSPIEISESYSNDINAKKAAKAQGGSEAPDMSPELPEAPNTAPLSSQGDADTSQSSPSTDSTLSPSTDSTLPATILDTDQSSSNPDPMISQSNVDVDPYAGKKTGSQDGSSLSLTVCFGHRHNSSTICSCRGFRL